MTAKGRYRVFDAYDCYMTGDWQGKPDYIGSSNTKQGVKHIIEKWCDETDGECYILIYDKVQGKEIDFTDI